MVVLIDTNVIVDFLMKRESHAANAAKIISLCNSKKVNGYLAAHTILASLENNDFEDFEDCLQMECALAIGAEYIITRNTSDFSNSKIPAIEPKDFLEIIENTLHK